MKYTQQDIARILGVTPMTIRNWRKYKPKLYEIVMKGFAFDELIQKNEKNLEELKELKEKLETKK
jgi:predicted transcriptional regulator